MALAALPHESVTPSPRNRGEGRGEGRETFLRQTSSFRWENHLPLTPPLSPVRGEGVRVLAKSD